MSGLGLKFVILACLRHSNPQCLVPVVGPAGCGTLLGRGDWEAKRACSKCPLGRSVPGAPHTSEHLILDPEHALYLTCPHPVLFPAFMWKIWSYFLGVFSFFAFWYLCLVLLFAGLFVCLVLVFYFLGFFNMALVQIDVLF